MAQTKHKEMDMLHGGLAGKLILFALPLAFSSILQQLFNSADVAVVGRFAGDTALAAAGRRSVENGCGCSRCRFEPRTNVIRMTEPAGDCCCICCCCNCAETDRAVAPSVSCEAVEAFKQAYADRSCGGNRRGCGCR